METTTVTTLAERDAWREARIVAETTDGITWDLPELRTHQADAVNAAYSQAAAYVWGRQDAGESSRDTGYSMDFAAAFARRRHMYETEVTCFMPNLERAFEQWRDTGRIEF